jgi:hypothetical protein
MQRPVYPMLYILSFYFLLAKGLIHCVRPLHALLDHLPKLGHVGAPRDLDALRAARQQLGVGAARLLAGLGLLKGALGIDCHLEALVVGRVLALLGVPRGEGNLVRCALEDGGDGEGVVQRRAGGDAEDVAGAYVLVPGLSCGGLNG